MQENQQLSKTIVITRPKGDEAILRDELLERGHHVICEPLTEIVLQHTVRGELEHILHHNHDPDAILITSNHGVQALALLTELRDMFLLCVGEATAHIATQLGFERVSVTGETVDHMIDYILDCYDEDARFLYVSGEHISTDLGETLGIRGMEVKRIAAYEAVATETLSDTLIEQLKRGHIDVLTFFSQRAVKIFTSLIEKHNLLNELEKIDAFCLSQNIADIAATGNWKKIHASEKPTLASLLTCIDNAYKK